MFLLCGFVVSKTGLITFVRTNLLLLLQNAVRTYVLYVQWVHTTRAEPTLHLSVLSVCVVVPGAQESSAEQRRATVRTAGRDERRRVTRCRQSLVDALLLPVVVVSVPLCRGGAVVVE